MGIAQHPDSICGVTILMLLSRYGLRAGEVAALRLKDVDWRHETLRVRRFKTATESLLPLLPPVGTALLSYLRHGRPSTEAREIFVCNRAPYRPFRHVSSIGWLVRHRLEDAGIQGRYGAHAFRHARAVSLLRADVPLKQIGDILGHSAPSSTAIYLKLATADLQSVGLEVPGKVQP